MSEEIKFRGKRKIDGEWVYGYYVFTHGVHRIIYEDYEGYYCEDEVVPETIGRFTGFLDKHVKEVYEGDKVQAWNQGYRGIFEIKWRQEGLPCWILYPAWQNNEFWEIHASLYPNGEHCDKGLEIIGNIHDNPEMMESEENAEIY